MMLKFYAGKNRNIFYSYFAPPIISVRRYPFGRHFGQLLFAVNITEGEDVCSFLPFCLFSSSYNKTNLFGVNTEQK